MRTASEGGGTLPRLYQIGEGRGLSLEGALAGVGRRGEETLDENGAAGMTGTQNGSLQYRRVTLPDGAMYHAMQTPAMVASSQGVSRCNVVVFQTLDGRRAGSVQLAPGVVLEELSDQDLVELLETVR